MRPEEVQEFARQEILPSLVSRYEGREFSRELWRKMGRAGLFGLLVPEEYGGSGGRPEELVSAIEAFVTGGQDLGLCLSWIVHLLIHTRVIASFGTPEQKSRYLPALVMGECVGALAASEPGTGADPVKMRARAEAEDGCFRIRAHKIYITNGSVADVVIVLARTGEQPTRENISAFLVERSTPGFRCEQQMDLGYLNTSPHGELVFDDCRVPANCLLGRPGDGHRRISRAVFGWERYLVTVGMATSFRLLLDRAVAFLGMEKGPGTGAGGDLSEQIAGFHIHLEALREMARGLAAEVLVRFDLDGRLLERLLFLGGSLAEWWDRFLEFFERASVPRVIPVAILINDARLLRVNQRLRSLQMKRLAESIFAIQSL